MRNDSFHFAFVSNSLPVAQTVRDYAAARHLHMEIRLATMEEALPVARALLDDGTDVILGGGGTVELDVTDNCFENGRWALFETAASGTFSRNILARNAEALTGGVTGPHNIPDIGFGLVPKNFNSYVVDNVAAVSSKDAQRAAQQVLRTDAIPASASAGAALHAAAKLVANGISRSALAVFSGRQNLL